MREGDRFTGGRAGGRALAVGVALLLLPAAVLLAPPVHRALEAAGLRLDFPQTLRRLLMIAGLGALLLAFRPWRDVPADRWGLRGPHARLSLVPLGAVLSIALLLALVLAEAATGRFAWDAERGVAKFWKRLPGNLAGFAVLAVLEEAVFRGWMLTRLRRRLPLVAAAAAGAAIFGVLHAFRGTAAPSDLPPTLAGAAEALLAWGRNLVDVADFLPRFVGLLLLATLLSAAYLRARSLYLPIGMHFGAVLFINQCSALTTRTPERDWMGSKWLYDGPPGWIAMALAAAALWPRRPRPPRASIAP